ncbi:A/G-specific adenine glycosylase [Asticcacaulis sp. AND118]|uniref:A/G-specific adenine glycosylase n=1 Tax=Asticcacaulis sp. AND118 TaxID=2840468 RepID=UPI001CFFA47E|nr:A/G-specific adenine glycosylase [Asticcacaulis sp. AND118]UDF02665.1 A/G-specific adenine glycosylase [Asticcacaulis sp. AND118]
MDEDVSSARRRLLDWYDLHARVLPWREGPGAELKADPYRVWMSEVMLQQTTVPHAAPYFEKFTAIWPTVADLAAAPDERVMAEWAGLGYYSRARNLLKCARAVVSEHGGAFPADEAALLKLPGFGPYTAAAVIAFAFGKAANVVDGNVERVMSRLYAVKTPVPQARPLLRELAGRWVREDRARDWPQALMDLSASVCRPKSPTCLLCPLQTDCAAFAEGQPEIYPVKAARPPKPVRHGVAFLIVSDEGVVVERRPDKGLLGGMLGLPHLDWRSEVWGEAFPSPWGRGWPEGPCEGAAAQKTPPSPDAPHLPLPQGEGSWRYIGAYEHVFTHFALKQQVWRIDLTGDEMVVFLRQHNVYQLLPHAETKALPTVFAKALELK